VVLALRKGRNLFEVGIQCRCETHHSARRFAFSGRNGGLWLKPLRGLGLAHLFANDLDAWFRQPSAFAVRAFGGFPQFVFAELESAFFALGGLDDGFVVLVLERLQQVRKVVRGILAWLVGEARDFGDGHRPLEQQRNEVFAEHGKTIAAGATCCHTRLRRLS
jgi:hypothetical protein